MARQNIETTDTLEQGRVKINANDTEEYSDIATATAAAAAAANAASTAQAAANAAQSTANAAQPSVGKDATGGYAGLTLFKINFKNALDTFTSFFTNSNTAARTYTFPDRTDTIATMQDIEVITVVSINGVATLDDTSFGKIHELIDNGGVTDYTLTLPTPSAGNANKTIYFNGLVALTKVVTLSLAAVTIEGDASIKIGKLGVIGLKSNGTNYTIIAERGSWIPFTIGFAGFSANPTAVDARYWKVGKKWTIKITMTVGTSNSTTTTITGLPCVARASENFIVQVMSNSAMAAGRAVVAAGTTDIILQLATSSGLAATGTKGAFFTIEIETQ